MVAFDTKGGRWEQRNGRRQIIGIFENFNPHFTPTEISRNLIRNYILFLRLYSNSQIDFLPKFICLIHLYSTIKTNGSEISASCNHSLKLANFCRFRSRDKLSRKSVLVTIFDHTVVNFKKLLLGDYIS